MFDGHKCICQKDHNRQQCRPERGGYERNQTRPVKFLNVELFTKILNSVGATYLHEATRAKRAENADNEKDE